MKANSTQDIKNTLAEVGINKSDNVFIHSSLFTLGRVSDVTPRDIPAALLNCFEHVVGKQGNIFMPCFNYDYPRTRNEDLRSQETVLGYWPEWFRNQDQVSRSGHPMFSICGRGPDAQLICRSEQPEFSAFGENSTFERLINSDSVLILQGIGMRVATVVVQIEAMLNLKYRFNKPFMGEVTLTNGQTVKDNFYHFCFPINNAYREDYSQLEQSLLANNIIKKQTLGRSFIYGIRMKALYEFIKQLTQKDQYALLNCRPQSLYRFEDGKEVSYPAPKY
ncbi:MULTISPECIES: AAC(3) family N-acetyltransferase [Pseudoalteromonas]|uniref:Aminoglycoside N(3)-acetyltransferase n=1 Tax=Pseudoalteromonas luteoviolacea (strain 2ta16) TaxID=1353533 RepID=V4HKX8_PSEL2|nr:MULTISPECIES: AAC(3) family N-acetyltransferase [Pseudoalteromonas]ESP90403.1 aminoglycoside N3'-acetyltransferase [Pseudoalteromonas luteoviolacea 2ta16]KZN42029.1 hypothetical protein N483_15260 [Pseudoalteromonas luteoviolacea NCIMB 1944]MCG7549889.1 AAC(3) family N-acetyltransferase [Pseudoalteromonas sp. Of7M-16]